MTDPTERREQAGRQTLDGHTREELAAFLAGCEWQHKTTIADVVADLRALADSVEAAGRDTTALAEVQTLLNADQLQNLAKRYESGRAERLDE
jgi:hypothetical protein